MFYYTEETIREYKSIMHEEVKIHKAWRYNYNLFSRAEDLMNLTIQILEDTHLAVVPRSYNKNYGLTAESVANISVAAHTYIMMQILYKATVFNYGPDYRKRLESTRETFQAASRHDLTENRTGDIADNGDLDEEGIARIEDAYLSEYSSLSPANMAEIEKEIAKIHSEFRNKSTSTGRLNYSADKTAGIVEVLMLEAINVVPLMSIDSPLASEMDKKNMSIAAKYNKGATEFTAGEMFTIAYFKTRDMIKYDESGFFTAIIILATLIVKHKWYQWREDDYTN